MGHSDSGDKSATICWWHRERMMGPMLSLEWHRSTPDGSGTLSLCFSLFFSSPLWQVPRLVCQGQSPACEVPPCSAAGVAPGHTASCCQQAGSAWARAVHAGVRHCHSHRDSSEARQEADGLGASRRVQTYRAVMVCAGWLRLMGATWMLYPGTQACGTALMCISRRSGPGCGQI